MLFHSFAFLVFFVVAFLVYWALPNAPLRKLWLLAASFYFYMSWNPWFILLVLFSACLTYVSALGVERYPGGWRRRALLVACISVNLGLLAFFKYANFFLDSAFSMQSWLGGPNARRVLDIILPLGISFYTFETISYLVDVSRGRLKPIHSLLDFLIFLLFFPHLVAGPIVRAGDFLPQLRRYHRFSWMRFEMGIRLILLGLFKKAVLADSVAVIIDPIFNSPAAYGSAAAWLAMLGYAAQIYLDFSGYSEMAVGLAYTLGFHLPFNFRFPYLAANIADFWRRWHISLSSWLRDYLFIPLGGSRGSNWATCRNLVVTMALGGLWHGANWTFVLWGLFHGTLLVGHRLLPNGRFWGLSFVRPFSVAATFLLVSFGWVFFRAQTLDQALLLVRRLTWPTAGAGVTGLHALIVIGVLALVLLGHTLGVTGTRRWQGQRVPAAVAGMGLAFLALLTMLFFPETGMAFIYFNF